MVGCGWWGWVGGVQGKGVDGGIIIIIIIIIIIVSALHRPSISTAHSSPPQELYSHQQSPQELYSALYRAASRML